MWFSEMEQRTVSRMTCKPIRLSALGREVKVGDLYDYNTDVIISGSSIKMPDHNIEIIPTSENEPFFFFKQSDTFKYHELGINSHFRQKINNKYLDETNFSNLFKQVWFNGYLKNNSIVKDEENTVQLDVFFRFKRRTEVIREQLLDYYWYQLIYGGRETATHMVEQVVYGAEFIFSMRRAIDRNETKEKAENSLRIAAKAYINEAISLNSIPIKKQPVELNNVICTNFCSLNKNSLKTCCSIQQSCEWLRETVGFGKEIAEVKWQAVEIVLRYIPDQIGARVLIEMKDDFYLEKELNKTRFNSIQNETAEIISSFVDACGVPPFKKIMCQFHALISELLHKLNKSDEIDFLKMGFPENILNEMKRMSYLFFGMAEWLLKRRIEIEKMCSLLKDTNLRMYDLSEIDALEPMANDKFALVFLLKMDYVKDPLLTRMQEFIGIQDSSLELPVFAILSLSEHHFEDMKKKLKAFSSESSFNTNTRSLIALVPPSYPANDGEIKEYSYKSNNINHEPPVISSSSVSTLVLCDEKSFDSIQSNHQQKAKSAKDEFQRVITKTNHIPTEADILNLSLSSDSKDVEIVPINEGSLMKTENLEQNSMKQSSDPMDLLKENSNGMLLHSDNQNHVEARTDYSTDESHHCQYKKTKESVADRIGKGQLHNLKGKPDNMPVKAETARMQTIQRKANSSSCQQEESAIVDQDQGSTMAIDSNTVDQRSKPIERSIPDAEKKKIAELFTQEEFAKLIKDGQPMVYQLNTKERPVGENLRYFDIKGQTETISSLKNSQNRKVIILMGATGSGKSTLINGMINYILGVQWKDPFRFKCVREDSSVVRNEAHSQTDSVTAYTLHHREGMAIPYSITLIDTPGYGDTRGIERDKEITKCIHLFLTQQQEIQIDQIHAICFVAASADSRLTPTQRYVLDSVLSIFGEDVKENIRLLVTFADNAIPPVVEACRAAHFPMTSPSDDVMYNKFNSSVLYASNDKKNERIKETMWNMGQRNYKTFFTMLESMNGCDLKSTRQVIENRQLLEKSLPDIEVELEICFDTIEKLKNRSLHGISYARKFTAMEKSQGLDTAIAKAMSLLNEVNKSGRVLNSVALRSHSSSAVDYLSLIRSRVIEEQRPGYQIRLQTLTELQNLLKGNAKTEVPRSQTSHQSSNSRLNAALTNEISGYSGQRTNVGRRNSEDVVAGDAFQQSTAGATDTKIIQSTETMPSSSASYDKTKHIKNPRGGAEGPSNMENPMQPCSANNEDVKKPTDFSSQSSSDPAECGSCRII